MISSEDFFKEAFIKLKEDYSKLKKEAEILKKILDKYLPFLDLAKQNDLKKQKELFNLIKFETKFDSAFSIVEFNREAPDFIVTFEDEPYGLELVELINEDKKLHYEFNQLIVKKIEEKFISKYGNISKLVVLSFKNDIIKINSEERKKMISELEASSPEIFKKNNFDFQLFYPFHLTQKDVAIFVDKIVYKIFDAHKKKYEFFDEDDILNYINFHNSKETLINKTHSFVSASISADILVRIAEKERKIEKYKENTRGLKQCLFLVVQGHSNYSSYATIDENLLKSQGSKFDKVILFNFFENEIFILK